MHCICDYDYDYHLNITSVKNSIKTNVHPCLHFYYYYSPLLELLHNVRLKSHDDVTTLNTAHYNGAPTVQAAGRGDRAGHHTFVAAWLILNA